MAVSLIESWIPVKRMAGMITGWNWQTSFRKRIEPIKTLNSVSLNFANRRASFA